MNIPKDHSLSPIVYEDYPDTHHDVYSKTVFGFWLYLLTDFVFFGIFFATYEVLQHGTFGGPGPKELFHLPLNFIQTLVLLTAAFCVGLGSAYVHQGNKKKTLLFFGLTFILGIAFILMQLQEFSTILHLGYDWSSSAFLSAYFSLLGMLLLHVLIASFWIIVLLFPLFNQKVDAISIKRLTCLKMFWQFINIVWLFIFSFVYLMGVYPC